ncbi:MAG: MarR family winged helix-turn-helix transcriptional regulator [Pseudomonadota bacterium]
MASLPNIPSRATGLAAPPVATRVLRQFRIVFNAVKTHFRQVERAAGIGGAQLWALSEIHAVPGMGVNELACALDIHQSTASNLVKGLIERKLITTERSHSDRRVIALHILEPGIEILSLAPTPFAGILPDALEHLDDATLARLENDLSKLIRLVKADDSGASIPLANL